MDLSAYIRTIPDHPAPGILFRDITTLLAEPVAFRHAVEVIAEEAAALRVSKVAGIEARGFILGGAIAHLLGAGFIPLRKKGKLPYATLSVEYDLEYGSDCLEAHADAAGEGERVLLVDDLIATGGTALAAVSLLGRLKAHLCAAAFVIDLPDLGGADRLRAAGVPTRALVSFPGH